MSDKVPDCALLPGVVGQMVEGDVVGVEAKYVKGDCLNTLWVNCYAPVSKWRKGLVRVAKERGLHLDLTDVQGRLQRCTPSLRTMVVAKSVIGVSCAV